MPPLRVAVVGVGHLGKEHARILAGLPDVQLAAVVDANETQALAVAKRLGTTAYTDYRQVLPQVDAATVVVPTTYHCEVACEFLRRGIPLLVEKPLASSLSQAQQIVDTARASRTLLQVGHIERFNGAFAHVHKQALQPRFVSAERMGPFTGRSMDIGVVLDLMIHDIDLVLQLVPSQLLDVEAVGMRLFGQHEDLANTRLHFADGCIVELTASRCYPIPSRKMQVWSPDRCALIDFHKKHVTLMEPAVAMGNGVQPSRNDSTAGRPAAAANALMETKEFDCQSAKDQLTQELEHFIQCVRSGSAPIVTGDDGLNALAVADRVLRSIELHEWHGSLETRDGVPEIPPSLGPLLRPLTGDAAA